MSRIRATAHYLGGSMYDLHQDGETGYMIDGQFNDTWDILLESEFNGQEGYEQFEFRGNQYYGRLINESGNE